MTCIYSMNIDIDISCISSNILSICKKQNHVFIQGSGTYSINVIDNETSVNACFEVQNGYSCYDPHVYIKYKQIDYDAIDEINEYLELQYKINGNNQYLYKKCNGGLANAECERTFDCINEYISTTYNNRTQWISGELYQFTFNLGENVDALCNGAKLDATIQVTCYNENGTTLSPTKYPTFDEYKIETSMPTLPTLHPTFEPTIPTNIITVSPTIDNTNDNNNGNDNNNEQKGGVFISNSLLIIIGMGFIIFILIVVVFVAIYCIKLKNMVINANGIQTISQLPSDSQMQMVTNDGNVTLPQTDININAPGNEIQQEKEGNQDNANVMKVPEMGELPSELPGLPFENEYEKGNMDSMYDNKSSNDGGQGTTTTRALSSDV